MAGFCEQIFHRASCVLGWALAKEAVRMKGPAVTSAKGVTNPRRGVLSGLSGVGSEANANAK